MKKKIIILIIFITGIIPALPVEILWQNKIHESFVNKIIFNETENLILSCGVDKKVKIINTDSGILQKEFSLENNIYDISFLANKNLLLLTTKHRTNSKVYIYNLYSDSIETIFNPDILLDTNKTIQNQEFMEIYAVPMDSNIILTGIGVYTYLNANHYYKGRLDLWDLKTGKWLSQIYSGGMINNLAISPDGKSISFSTLFRSSEYVSPWIYKEIEETKLYLTDTSFKNIFEIRTDYDENMEFADTEVINEISFSPDSKFIAVATDEHHLFVYDVEKNTLKDSIYSCECYADQTIGFVYDGKHVISGTNNGKVNIWNLEYGLKIDSYTFNENPYITSISASKKHNLYAVADVNGNISLLTSWYLSKVEDKMIINKPEYKISYNKNILELNFTNTYNQSFISVYNLLGQKVENLKIENNGNSIIIDYSNLTNGIYILVGNSGEEIFSEKFQKMD